MFDSETPEWERHLLKQTREIWALGEGEVIFKVWRQQGREERQWKIEKVESVRGKEK